MAPNTIFDYQPAWPARFAELAAGVRLVVGDDALRIDHIGSTSVPGLASKDVIDLQVTVADLHVADDWPEHLATFNRWPGDAGDHLPPGAPENPADWTKRYWSRSQPSRAHLHVREAGRPNQRYALLFRDFLHAHPNSASAYERVKRQLAALYPDDGESYSELKDPVCDVIMESAELWVAQTGWEPGTSDA